MKMKENHNIILKREIKITKKIILAYISTPFFAYDLTSRV